MRKFAFYVVNIVSATVICGQIEGQSAFGEFDLRINNVDSCKGPKKLDCTKIEYSVAHQGQIAVYSIVPQDTKITEFHLTMGKVKTRPIIDLHLRKPCQQVYIKEYLQIVVKDIRACVAHKGKYNMTVDYAAINQKYWAGKFFFGDFISKITILNEHCNFSCTALNVTFSPIHS